MAGIRQGRKTAATLTFMDSGSTSSLEKTTSVLTNEHLIRYESRDAELAGQGPVVANMETIALKALHIDDDSSLNPWTARMFLLGRASTDSAALNLY